MIPKDMAMMHQDGFSTILMEVCKKTAKNARILNGRLRELWKKHLDRFNAEMHPIRQFNVEDARFHESSVSRAAILEQCELALVDAYWAIKMIAIALFKVVPPTLKDHFPAFRGEHDDQRFVLKIAEKFVNALMKFFAIESDIAPAHALVYGKIHAFLRVKKSMTVDEITQAMTRAGFNGLDGKISKIMMDLEQFGLVTLDGGQTDLYHHASKLILDPDQEQVMKAEFIPLIDWAINTWRSLFNIRELNTPVPETYPDHQLVTHIVSHAATQGFTTAHFCMSELKKYFRNQGST
ncbi:hypothetical protein GF325_04890 [Candidatus Bathyarchaeota archaeon]|nr:hypothetical protein [Candidatus Bathyarchaeota archaeon]